MVLSFVTLVGLDSVDVAIDGAIGTRVLDTRDPLHAICVSCEKLSKVEVSVDV